VLAPLALAPLTARRGLDPARAHHRAGGKDDLRVGLPHRVRPYHLVKELVL
jgi:hypothetical protein